VIGAFRIFAVGWALQERQIVESQAGANLAQLSLLAAIFIIF
jgi:hypothetical protein